MEELFREAVIISTETFPLFQEKQIEGGKTDSLKAIYMLLYNYYVKGIKLKWQRLDATKV